MHDQSTPRGRRPHGPQRFVAVCPMCGRLFYAIPKAEPRGATKLCSRACWKTTLPLPAARFWGKVARGAPDSCWLWQAKRQPRGYGTVWWRGRSNVLAHRVAWELTHGPIPEGMNVLHRCDVPLCCNPAHLFLGTIADNNRDMGAKGRHWAQREPGRARQPFVLARRAQRGMLHPQAKLTDDDVRIIRAGVAAGALRRTLAAEYGVSASTVGRLVARRRWSHVA